MVLWEVENKAWCQQGLGQLNRGIPCISPSHPSTCLNECNLHAEHPLQVCILPQFLPPTPPLSAESSGLLPYTVPGTPVTPCLKSSSASSTPATLLCLGAELTDSHHPPTISSEGHLFSRWRWTRNEVYMWKCTMFERRVDSLPLTDTENPPECSCQVNKVCFTQLCALQSGRDVPRTLLTLSLGNLPEKSDVTGPDVTCNIQ